MGRRKTPKREDVLTQALSDVRDRAEIYGDALENHSRVAVLMSAWEGCKSPGAPKMPLDSIVFQIMTNLARLAETPGHKGAWDNIAGYAAIGYEVTNP